MKFYDRPFQRILLICAAFFTLFASCNYVTPVGEVEDMLSVKLRRKIKYIEKQEQWMFGSDGYKIETFKVMDSLNLGFHRCDRFNLIENLICHNLHLAKCEPLFSQIF